MIGGVVISFTSAFLIFLVTGIKLGLTLVVILKEPLPLAMYFTMGNYY